MKNRIGKYLSLVTFSHTIFAMPFAIMAFFMAIKFYDYQFDAFLLVFVVLCMVFARNAAMAFNRLVDKDIDYDNPRTNKREIPAKEILPKNALIFTLINISLFVVTTLFINRITFYLSPVAIAVILLYSYTKRFTFLAHLFLGLALSIAPIGAFLAVTAKLELTVLLLGLVVFLWTSGFDIIYALQDEEFDRKRGLFSIPAMFGARKALWISSILHFCCFIVLMYFGLRINTGIWLWIGISIFTILLIYQHLIVKPNDISRINLAFGTLNGLASLSFAIFVIISFFV